MKPKNIFLTLSIILIGVSVAVPGNIYLDVGLPIGVILFGLFMVATVMEKESALYDAQLAADAPKPVRATTRFSKEVAAKTPALTHAHSH